MVDLLETEKVTGADVQNFSHQRFPVFPGIGAVLGQAEPEIKRHDGDPVTGSALVLFRVGYGGNLCHRAIECKISSACQQPVTPDRVSIKTILLNH